MTLNNVLLTIALICIAISFIWMFMAWSDPNNNRKRFHDFDSHDDRGWDGHGHGDDGGWDGHGHGDSGGHGGHGGDGGGHGH